MEGVIILNELTLCLHKPSLRNPQKNIGTAMQVASLSLEPILQSLFTIYTMTDAASVEYMRKKGKLLLVQILPVTHATSSPVNGLMSLIPLTCDLKLPYWRWLIHLFWKLQLLTKNNFDRCHDLQALAQLLD